MTLMKLAHASVLLGGLLFGVVPPVNAMQKKSKDEVIKEQARKFLLILIKHAGKVSNDMETIFQQAGDEIVDSDQLLAMVCGSMTFNDDGLKCICSFDAANGHGALTQHYFSTLNSLNGYNKKVLSSGSKQACLETDKVGFLNSSNLILALALRGALVNFFTNAKIVSREFKGDYPKLLSLENGIDPLSKMLQAFDNHNELLLNKTVLNGFCDEVNKCFANVELPSWNMKIRRWIAIHPRIASGLLGALIQICFSYSGHESSQDGRPISFQKLDMQAFENVPPQVILAVVWSYLIYTYCIKKM